LILKEMIFAEIPSKIRKCRLWNE